MKKATYTEQEIMDFLRRAIKINPRDEIVPRDDWTLDEQWAWEDAKAYYVIPMPGGDYTWWYLDPMQPYVSTDEETVLEFNQNCSFHEGIKFIKAHFNASQHFGERTSFSECGFFYSGEKQKFPAGCIFQNCIFHEAISFGERCVFIDCEGVQNKGHTFAKGCVLVSQYEDTPGYLEL